MHVAVRTYRSSLWIGLALTVTLAAVTFYFELRELHQAAAVRLGTQLDNAEQRLSMAAAELQAAVAFVEQANPSPTQFEAFISKLPLSKQRRAPWSWAETVDPKRVAEFENRIRAETGDQTYAVKSEAAGGTLVPVVASFGKDFVPSGTDLGKAKEVAAAVRSAALNDGRAVPMFSIPQDVLSEHRFFLAYYLAPRIKSGEPPRPASVFIRGTSLDALSAAAGLEPDQRIRVTDLDADPAHILLGPQNSDGQYSWTASAPIDVSPLRLGLAISQSRASLLPKLWLVPLLAGLFATLAYVVFRAGLLIRRQANAAIAQLAGAEKSLSTVRERELHFFEHSGTANCEVDFPSSMITRVNDAFCRLFGYGKDELLGRYLAELTHADDKGLVAETLANDDGTGKPGVQTEKRYRRKDGSVMWAVANASLNTDPVTGRQSYLVVIVDITERKNDEETKALLLRELAHRVRNTVQLTASLARQTARSARSIKDYDNKFQLRLAALSAAHDLLFERNWRSAPLARIAGRSLQPLLPEDASVCPVKISLPEVELTTQQAQTLAIAIQELAANSAQYGALMHGGEICLDGALDTDPESRRRTLKISWRETSLKRFRKPHKAGFGTIMLGTVLPEQFGGTADLSWRPNGLHYAASLPLD